MTDPHDMVGIGYPDAREGIDVRGPLPMTVRSMDISARVEHNPREGRRWFVLWLVGGAVLWFSPDPDPGPEMRSTR